MAPSVSLREVRLQSVPWDRKCGCAQSQAQTWAELIHPCSDPVALPGFSATAPPLQFTQAFMGKRQPSVLEGNLTCQQCTGDNTSSVWLHWKGFCAKSAWGSGRSTPRSSAAHSRAQPGAAHLGRDVTKVAACGELLQPGGLCSSAVWELLQFLCQTSTGHGWPQEG